VQYGSQIATKLVYLVWPESRVCSTNKAQAESLPLPVWCNTSEIDSRTFSSWKTSEATGLHESSEMGWFHGTFSFLASAVLPEVIDQTEITII
jgi:hypothetical protein